MQAGLPKTRVMMMMMMMMIADDDGEDVMMVMLKARMSKIRVTVQDEKLLE